MPPVEIARLRAQYHETLCAELLTYRSKDGALNIADGSNKASRAIAENIVDQLSAKPTAPELPPQKIGNDFARVTTVFLEESFRLLKHIRPGDWRFSTNQAKPGIALYDQYKHLAELQSVLAIHPDLKAALGGDYLITPDIIVARVPIADSEINRNGTIVDPNTYGASLTPLRLQNIEGQTSILHASVSCKWTMRSDRAQNTRTEALNLIRNRKGGTPRIVYVTFEPLPIRLASIAFGTGDLDCTYHVALDELRVAVENLNTLEHKEILDEMIDGRRIRDISDLPFDLAT